MKNTLTWIPLTIYIALLSSYQSQNQIALDGGYFEGDVSSPTIYKPRVINTTDLGADPDDKQSMVRQLVCANEFDIGGTC